MKKKVFSMLLVVVFCFSSFSSVLASDEIIPSSDGVAIADEQEKVEKEMAIMQELLDEANEVPITEAGVQSFEALDEEGNIVRLEINTEPVANYGRDWSLDNTYSTTESGFYAGNWTTTMTWTGTYCGTIKMYCGYKLYFKNNSDQYAIDATSISHSETPPGNYISKDPYSRIYLYGPNMASYEGIFSYWSGPDSYGGRLYNMQKVDVTIIPIGHTGISLRSNLWSEFIY